MTHDPWSRARTRTVPFEGVPRAVQFARLDLGQKANLTLLLAIFRSQSERLARLLDEPAARQIAEIAEERKANIQFGAWVEEMLREAVRPVEPWTSAEGIAVIDGASFVEAHGDDDLTAALMVLYDVNTVSRATAKNSGSPRGSSPGSDDASPAARGDAPAPTVGPAASSGFASPGAASVPSETSPSGSMTSASGPSSPSPVLSAV
jgi:hypothetical protein